jgi:hypothetical protein
MSKIDFIIMNYKKTNTYLGWLVFLIATTVYFITLEDTVSLWDCGEYITAAYKLEVGHPPGAPLFMLIGRIFSFFAAPENVAVWINRVSALSSSASILFMFWSITLLSKKMALKKSRILSKGQMIAIFGSGIIGSLSYTFTDSFWFSAVEGEVYAMSSLFTALIFWAILKWDEETDAIKHNELALETSPLRWMILILFLFGLAIGVHLLGLLVIPSIGFIIYFNQSKTFSWKGFFITAILSIFTLGFIQEGIIPGTISWASKFEIAFVNSMGLPFYMGSMFFFALLIFGSLFLVRWSRKTNKPILNAAALGLIVFLIGYGSFATIVIRSSSNTPLDENDPENLVTLHAYLKREQYGSWPILFGPYWNSKMEEDQTLFKDRSKFYARRFVVTKGDQDLKAFKDEKNAVAYSKKLGRSHEVIEKYFVTNEDYRKNQEPVYSQNTLLPRMFLQDPSKIDGYKSWSGYDETEDKGTEIGSDGKRLPTFGENITYLFKYQVNWMYWRYFMWNFSGRQNDIQGHGDAIRGNWKSGFKSIDKLHLGAQNQDSPTFTSNNESNNSFYFIPLILGLIGMLFHFYKAPKDAFVVLLTFIFTGLAIVFYLNQKPFEPRERDYAYAASFYVFTIWIGLSVYALFEIYNKLTKKEIQGIGIISLIGLFIFFVIDLNSSTGFTASLSWLYISVIGGILIGITRLIGSKNKDESKGAILAIVLTSLAPILLSVQGWDDHDRSNKTSARDLAFNYLESCKKNGILFTNGDNDTFPLWYLQEVEEKRTDVRVCNLSLMQTDWYTDQMKMKAYDSDPLPIKFREDQIMMYAGNTDQVYFLSMLDLMNSGISSAVLTKIIDLKIKSNKTAFKEAFNNLQLNCAGISSEITAKDQAYQANLTDILTTFNTQIANPSAKDVEKLATSIFNVLIGSQKGIFNASQEILQQLQQQATDWETSWDFIPIEKAMEFVRDDANLITINNSKLRIFPSKGFIVPINKAAILKSGLLTKEQVSDLPDKITFKIDDKQAITREQVMMLDVIGNNDWKRPIYFSSPGGSDVSIALYQGGYIQQNGMVYEFTPLQIESTISKEKMYTNLMKTYDYGKMNQKGVISDYYTRRHTSQYRDMFLRLAETFLNDIDNNDLNKENADISKSSGQIEAYKKFSKNILSSSKINEYKALSIKLIKKSLEVMPLDRVIDYGEPTQAREKAVYAPGEEYPLYNDGVTHDYVNILLRAGDKKGAEKLAIAVSTHLESIIRYFETSRGIISFKNKQDLVSAISNYCKLTRNLLAEKTGISKAKITSKNTATISRFFNISLPKLISEIREEEIASSEITQFEHHIKSVGVNFGFVKGGLPSNQPQNQQISPEMIQQMMQNQ